MVPRWKPMDNGYVGFYECLLLNWFFWLIWLIPCQCLTNYTVSVQCLYLNMYTEYLLLFSNGRHVLKIWNLMKGKFLYNCFCILFVCLFFCLVFLNWGNGWVRRSWSRVPIFFIKQPSFVTGFVTWPPKHKGHDDTV